MALGLVIRATILRFGSNAEVVAWSLAFLLQPVSAVFYPVDVLPAWLERVAFFVPASHVFEAVRAFLATGAARYGELAWALALDGAYLVGGAALAAKSFHAVRRLGLLSRPGY
jgi:ABC-2 type transport system permease protein